MADLRECRIQKLTEKDLERAADALDIDPNNFPALLEGMNVELEHCSWTDGDAIITTRIALDHLREDKDYYSKLKAAGL